MIKKIQDHALIKVRYKERLASERDADFITTDSYFLRRIVVRHDTLKGMWKRCLYGAEGEYSPENESRRISFHLDVLKKQAEFPYRFWEFMMHKAKELSM